MNNSRDTNKSDELPVRVKKENNGPLKSKSFTSSHLIHISFEYTILNLAGIGCHIWQRLHSHFHE